MKNKPAAAVDRSAAAPLYHQIFLQVRDEILSGQRPFGSAVATEMELSHRYRVSRILARRALDELAQHHFVNRKRRVGTTVIFRPPEKPFEANIDQAVDSLLVPAAGRCRLSLYPGIVRDPPRRSGWAAA